MSMMTDPKAIELYRLFTTIKMSQLEAIGLRRKGRSAHSVLLKDYGFKGNREKRIELATKHYEEEKAKLTLPEDEGAYLTE